MYAPILALLIDFVCDIQYLNQISSYTNRNLMDKHIHIGMIFFKGVGVDFGVAENLSEASS